MKIMKALLIAAFISATVLFLQSTPYNSIAIEVADFRVEVNIVIAAFILILLFLAFYFLLRAVAFIRDLPDILKKKIEALSKKNKLECMEDILLNSFGHDQQRFEKSLAALKNDLPEHVIDLCKYRFHEYNNSIDSELLKKLLLHSKTKSFALKNLSRLELKIGRYSEALGHSMQLLSFEKNDKEAVVIYVTSCILSNDWQSISLALPYIRKNFSTDASLLLESIMEFKVFMQHNTPSAKCAPSKKSMDVFHPWIFLSIRSCISRSDYDEAMGIMLRYWDIYREHFTPMVINILISYNDGIKLARKLSDPLINDLCNVLAAEDVQAINTRHSYYEILVEIYKKCAARQFLDISALLNKLALLVPNLEKYYYLDVQKMQLCDSAQGEFCYKISGIANFIKAE